MKKSELSFMDGFLGLRAKRSSGLQKAFDWDKAAKIIKTHLKKHKDITADAGLQGDWAYTGGEIFGDGKPTNEEYTFLSSNWAGPTLILSWDGKEQYEEECSIEENERFNSHTKWDEESLKILGISI